MSMNLHCKGVDLWQTPTYISYMCYSNEDGGSEGIRYRYEQWVRSHISGVWENEEDYLSAQESVRHHLNEITEAAKAGPLEFYIL